MSDIPASEREKHQLQSPHTPKTLLQRDRIKPSILLANLYIKNSVINRESKQNLGFITEKN